MDLEVRVSPVSLRLSLMGMYLFPLFICVNTFLITYSSVAHIGLVVARIFTLGMIVTHDLCSSGLFCLVTINYERLGRRSLLVNKGLINLCPFLTFCKLTKLNTLLIYFAEVYFMIKSNEIFSVSATCFSSI